LSLVLTFAAYAFGAVTGLAVHRAGPRLRAGWPIYLRIQLAATAALIGLFSAWRLTAPRQIVAPLVMAAAGGVLLVSSYLIRRGRSTGLAQLEAWAAFPNSTFWVLPIGGALVGPAASVVAGLTNAAYAVPTAVCVHLLRRDAPIHQRHRERDDGLRFLFLTAIRVAFLTAVVIVTQSTAVAVVAVLSAFGPPAFNPPQQSVLYGYRSGVVMVAARWGWIFLPVGLVLALLLR